MVTPFIPKCDSADSGHSILSPPLHLTSLFGKHYPTPLLSRWYTGKESACSAGDTRDAGLILGLGRLPGEGNGNLPQYSCLGNPLNRGAWWATVHGVAQSRTQLKRLHTHAGGLPKMLNLRRQFFYFLAWLSGY